MLFKNLFKNPFKNKPNKSEDESKELEPRVKSLEERLKDDRNQLSTVWINASTALLLAVISGIFSLINSYISSSKFGDIQKQQQKLEERQQEIENIVTNLKVLEGDIKNKNANPIEVKARLNKDQVPLLKVELSMGENKQTGKNIGGYNLHILQRESGFGTKYYYQGSTTFIPDQTTDVDVALGSKNDINKTYEILVVANKDSSYQKTNGVKTFEVPPGPVLAGLVVKRVE